MSVAPPRDRRYTTGMMKDRPRDERPRERLLRNGGEALTLRELIAVLIDAARYRSKELTRMPPDFTP
jgi:hypothetical protein